MQKTSNSTFFVEISVIVTIMRHMKRIFYKNLKAWADSDHRKPLILRGVRQSGKTFGLLEFGRTYFPSVHYINFEKDKSLQAIFERNLDPQRIIEEISFYLNKPINIETDLLIFDEIQDCPLALTSLKYFCEEMPGLALCCAGSLLGIYLGGVSFPVGKISFLDIYPLSFLEFLRAISEDMAADAVESFDSKTDIPMMLHKLLWDRLKWYFITGGLPEIVNIFCAHKDNLFHAFELVRARQLELVVMYSADMAKHSGRENALHLDRVWHSVPMQLAKTLDGSANRFKFKGVVPGIDRYQRLAGVIDWLINAGLVIKVPVIKTVQKPLVAYTKENQFKLYAFDVGVLGAMSQLSPKTILDYDYGTYKGYFAESFVAQEFLVSGKHDLYCWQHYRAEVEFLWDSGQSILPIEVKSGNVTKSKALKFYAEKYQPEYRTTMSAKPLYIDALQKHHEYPLYMAYHFPLLT